jgi:hypothetical protein
VTNFCDHCLGQRFDRARVLRALRRTRTDLRRAGRGNAADEALVLALQAVARLELPHLEPEEPEDQVVH